MTDTLYLSVAQARETMPCPLARTFADKKGPNCMGDACPVWRWKPRLATDPEFSAAIKREMYSLAEQHKERTGKEKAVVGFHNKAVQRIVRNPEGYGIERKEGYCGLGGAVT